MNLRDSKTASERRKAVENARNASLPNIGSFTLDESAASTRNCENMIGAIQIPVGIAGPLKILSTYSLQPTTNNYYIPLATTEGALVASVNRGCKAVSQSGGATVVVERAGATRGPVFRVEGILQGRKLVEFLSGNFESIKATAEGTSHHLTLLRFDHTQAGRFCYVRFYFDTKDAMGLNMVTIAADAIAKSIKESIDIDCLALSGNYCVDKKASALNMISGRGFRVWAEATISARTLTEVLKTTANNVFNVWLSKCMIGSVLSASLGYNAQFANVVAAIFLATGQDPAHVVEGSMGVTTTEIIPDSTGDNLYVSIYMPDLMVGTVGGGTGLATQREGLEILGVAGGENGVNSERLAGIVGATVLAGELSLLSSLAEGSLATAHKKLGRGIK